MSPSQACVLKEICVELTAQGEALTGRDFASMRSFLLLLDAAESEIELAVLLDRAPNPGFGDQTVCRESPAG